MKLMFNLAVVTKEGQTVEELLKPYMEKEDGSSLENNIKEQQNFISGVVFGYTDQDYIDNMVLIKKGKKLRYCCRGLIKEIDWEKIVSEYNKKADENETKMDLDNLFAVSHSIITPDGEWHGMIPGDIISIGFSKTEPREEYLKNYYNQYIKPYNENGHITILTCNI